jgi:type IV pilus assembly protein PilE
MKQQGFTLVEMLVVVAIIGIIAAVAMPAYQEHVDNARRAQAKGALVAFATRIERHYAETGSYEMASDGATKMTADSLFYSAIPQGASGDDRDYILSIDDSGTDDETYLIKATANGVMSGDGDFTLSSTGEKTWGSNACWEKSC